MFKSELTPEDFAAWLVKASCGDRLIYGVGAHLPARKPEVAKAAYRAHEAKQVLLAQKKIGPSTYNYVAIRASTNLVNPQMRAGK